MRHVSGANDLAGDALDASILQADFEVDGLALVKREQQLLCDGIVAVILLEDLELRASVEIAQDHGLGLEERRGVGKAYAVDARSEVHGKDLAHEREILVVDGD